MISFCHDLRFDKLICSCVMGNRWYATVLITGQSMGKGGLSNDPGEIGD